MSKISELKVEMKVDVKLSLWSAIKMRIAGVPNLIRLQDARAVDAVSRYIGEKIPRE